MKRRKPRQEEEEASPDWCVSKNNTFNLSATNQGSMIGRQLIGAVPYSCAHIPITQNLGIYTEPWNYMIFQKAVTF